jgi:hypothetical protein
LLGCWKPVELCEEFMAALNALVRLLGDCPFVNDASVDANVSITGDVLWEVLWLKRGDVICAFEAPGELLLNKSVEKRGDVWLEALLLKLKLLPLLENKSKGTSIFGVPFLLTSVSGDVAREDCPDRNSELSVRLPLEGDGDDCCPLDLALEAGCWKGLRTVA